jgi:hypothetical protein
VRLSPGGKELYVTQGALARVLVVKTDDLSTVRTLLTDKHPNDVAFSPDGRVFVSCGSSDSVVAVDPESGLVRERISVTLTPRSPAGTTPNALSFSPDGKTLFVANADNNAVAVVNIEEKRRSIVQGFIPTGWYPTLVFSTPDGKSLLIGSGKGMGTRPSSPKIWPADRIYSKDPYEQYYYVAAQFEGMLSRVQLPQASDLAKHTRQVLENTPYRDEILNRPLRSPKPGSNPIPSRLGDTSPIKHILYIIKENRTYDQVLGDLKDKDGKPRGNGDPDLVLFGENVTPNLHQIARDFVTLDNTYCIGDVSGNGHPWSTAAYGTDIGERSWMLAYGGHAAWALTDLDLFPPVGRIWDVCERLGLSWASYYFTWTTTNTVRNMSDAWAKGFWERRDRDLADTFIADLRRYERENNLPRFMIMALREDHTDGTQPGKFTPPACVASNDQGVGKIVDACSKSKFWKEMAIFIIEDDAQDGPDHVDAHRTTAFVISPYTRTGKVDSTQYTTVSLLRTMELILGLPPMSQYDAAAVPMYNAFTNKPDFTPYDNIPPRINLEERNTQTAYGAAESDRIDFSRPDNMTAGQVDTLNRILWHSIKGADFPYPGTVRRALLTVVGRSLITD